VVVLVDPIDRSILVFRPSSVPRSLRGTDSLEIPDVLPGFQSTVDEVFAALKQ
jgi:Uma2 family endonuclease